MDINLLPEHISVSLCSSIGQSGIDVFFDEIPEELYGKPITVTIQGFDFINKDDGDYKCKNFTLNYKTKCVPFLSGILDPVFKKICRSNHNYFYNHCYLELFELDTDTMTAYMHFGS